MIVKTAQLDIIVQIEAKHTQLMNALLDIIVILKQLGLIGWHVQQACFAQVALEIHTLVLMAHI